MPRLPGEEVVRFSEAQAQRLVRFYMEAELEILREMERKLARGAKIEYLEGLQRNISLILKDLMAGSKQWTEEVIPQLYTQGIDLANADLERAGMRLQTGFGAIHQQAVQLLADNTYQRLEDVIRVIGRQAEDRYRQAALETTRQSVIGGKSWQQVARDFRRRLEDQGVTGFRDKRDREWNMKTYAEMVARTTTMEAHLGGTANRLIEHGHDLVRVSDHLRECPRCRPWEGKVLSLTGKTEGYPTLEEAKGRGLFHPRCRHTFGLFLPEMAAGAEEGPAQGSSEPGAPSGKSLPVSGIPAAAHTGLLSGLSEAQNQGLKTGNEQLLTYDVSTGKEVYNRLQGTHNEVVFPQSLVDFLNQAAEETIVLTHNHPNNSAFSDIDVALLAKFKSLKGLLVIGHDGTMYYVGKTGASLPSGAVFRADYQKFLTKHSAYFQRLVTTGQMTVEEAWKNHTHRAVEDLAKAHKLEYMRWTK